MGTVLSLADWIRDSGQWTAAERGRLQALTDHFPGGGDLEVVFGATDDGAPWCAVMDEAGEVLVHVARLADQFLVHVAGEEVVSRGDNLTEALERWLRPEPEPAREPVPARPGVVVPFGRLPNGVDVIILVAVAVLLDEKLRHHLPQTLDGVAWPIADNSVAGTQAALQPAAPLEIEGAQASTHGSDEERSNAPIVAALTPLSTDTDDAPPSVPHAAPAAVAAATASTQVAQPVWQESQQNLRADGQVALLTPIRGGDGDDILIGGDAAEHLIGGDGDDVLIGGGGRDVLDGGAGDDWIVLASEALAAGGSGADTFVISAPDVMDQADTLLGRILDFDAREGDRLVTADGETVPMPRWDEPPGGAPETRRGPHKVEVDVDGNGRVDGYVLVGPGDAEPVDPAPAPEPTDPGFDPCRVAPSESWSGWIDIIG